MADYSRDYYADLELPSSAEISDIKKQFRKLALKYHPDRNPGKEAEVNAKFQTIQAAHEILSSPDQKAKYDAQRRSRPGAASGVRGNPWQDVSAQYPMPPRRPGQAPTSATRNSASGRTQPSANSYYSGSSSSSAHRYSNFNVPPTAKKTSKEDLDSNYHAFQNMRQKQKPKPGQSASAAYASSSGRSKNSGTAPPSSSMPPPPPPRQTASQKQKAEASFGNRRSQGFVPQSPVGGDEPPAANSTSNYSSSRSHDRGRFFADATGSPAATSGAGMASSHTRPPPPPPTANTKQSRSSEYKYDSDDAYYDTRQSTPYQTHGGEKLDPFDGVSPANLYRTKSGRTTGTTEPNPSTRRRSTSLPDEADGSSVGGGGGGGVSAQDADYRSGHSQRPNMHRAGSRTRPGVGSRQDSTSLPSTPMPRFDQQYERMREGEQPGAASAQPAHSGQSAHSPEAGARKPGPIFSSFSFDDEAYTSSPSTPNLNEQQAFNFASNSAEDITTNFATKNPPDGKWQFQAGGTDPESGADSPTVRRAQSNGRLGRRSPGKDRSNSKSSASGGPSYAHPSYPPPPPPRPVPSPGIAEERAGAAPEGPSTFDPEKWTEQFRTENFAPQYPPPPPPVPPRMATPPARPMKKPKPVQKPGARTFTAEDGRDSSAESGDEPYAHTQQQPPQQQEQQAQNLGTPNVDVPEDYASPNAMDIDSPPQSPKAVPASGKEGAAASQSAGDAQSNGVRNVPVEPSRHEWRAGDVKTTSGTSGTSKPTTNPIAEASAAGGASLNAGGSEDTEEFRTTFADFRNVEPFAERTPGIMGSGGPGLGSFTDLRSNLPFESRASSSRMNVPLQGQPLPAMSRRKTIRFPKPPVAPNPPPALAVPGLQPAAGAWEKYETEFRHYMAEWTEFNNLFVDHFQARRSEAEVYRRQGNFGFMSPSQDDESILTYLQWIEQDQEVRSQWAASAASHEQSMRQFMAFREQMK